MFLDGFGKDLKEKFDGIFLREYLHQHFSFSFQNFPLIGNIQF